MNDLDFLRTAALEIRGMEKTAYDPLEIGASIKGAFNAIREARAAKGGINTYGLITGLGPDLTGRALQPVGAAARAVGNVATVPLRMGRGAVSAGAKRAGKWAGGGAWHIAKNHPIETGLVVGLPLAIPSMLPEILDTESAGRAQGMNEIARGSLSWR